MIELGSGADLLRGIGTSLVIGLFVAYPGRWAWERKKEMDTYHAALAKAEAVFNERCKTEVEMPTHRASKGVPSSITRRKAA